ncbi:MAG TPA: Hsp33 family molecular chaperone HslO [Chromatiales bacterium]|nr:Hsp33 family molecular chaperone HslO [Chromatiales bacterium]HEX22793.1 Hsp33 family molecular chaperone HslO [Chromatiales bacterium]
MKERDTLHNFLFEHAAIRGDMVHLDATWREVLKRHEYPAPLRSLLGELMVAAALLTARLKFEGSLTLQLQGSGPVTLGVVECSSERLMRGLLRWEGDIEPGPLHQLMGTGQLVITIEQRRTGERYQGVVDVAGDSIAEAIERYLAQSEQLETRLWLVANEQSAAGLLVQRMPTRDEAEDVDAWPRVVQLADTVKDEELLGLDAHEILHRLFFEEDVRLFEALPVAFRCGCSFERVENTLRMLGHDEIRSIIEERGTVDVTCEFCNQKYVFDAVDAEALFIDRPVSGDSSMHH